MSPLKGTNGLNTAAPSKAFARSQGKPFVFNAACTSRLVRSKPKPTPKMTLSRIKKAISAS